MAVRLANGASTKQPNLPALTSYLEASQFIDIH